MHGSLLLAPLLFSALPVLRAQEPAPEVPKPAEDSKPAPAPAPVIIQGPRTWLEIAEAEAARTTRTMREKVLNSLRNYMVQRDVATDHGRSFLETIVHFGPDAAPLLLDVLRGAGKGSYDLLLAEPAARSLVGIWERTKNEALLRSLGGVLAHTDPIAPGEKAVNLAILAALEAVDDPVTVELVVSQLTVSDGALQAQAVRVLGRQKKSATFVAGVLRPLLAKDNAPVTEALAALLQLRDKQSLDAAHGILMNSADPTRLAVALRFVNELGGRNSIAPIKNLLLHGPQGLPDPLLMLAIDALQQVGLREVEAHKPAEDVLVECFQKHENSSVREWARWQLGPYQNEAALKSLEDEKMVEIKANEKARRTNVDRLVELADIRLQFEQWQKAITALDRAKDEDDRNSRASYIDELKAVALCGLDQFPKAQKLLVDVSVAERLQLLTRFKVLGKMARDPKYKSLFE